MQQLDRRSLLLPHCTWIEEAFYPATMEQKEEEATDLTALIQDETINQAVIRLPVHTLERRGSCTVSVGGQGATPVQVHIQARESPAPGHT